MLAAAIWGLMPREEPVPESAIAETVVLQPPSQEIVEHPAAETPEVRGPQDSPAPFPDESTHPVRPQPAEPQKAPVPDAATSPQQTVAEKPHEAPPQRAIEERPVDPVEEGDRSSEALVLAALESEVAGYSDRRDELLLEALAADPDCAPARWHSGYVRMGGEWLSVDEIHRRFGADERLAEYRQLRATHADTPMGELALARWCRNAKLEVEERVHWLKALQFQPFHEEALKNLGMRWYKGLLLTHDQIEQMKTRIRQADAGRVERPSKQSWGRHWTPLVSKWRRAIEDGSSDVAPSIREELLAVEHHEGLEVLDWLIHQRCRLKKEHVAAYQTLSLKLIEVVDGISEPWAVYSLVRHAIYHPSVEVSSAAADALGERSVEDYVPLLLSHMRSPTEASFLIVVHPDGSVTYQHSFYREGFEADSVETRNESTYLRSQPVLVGPTDRGRVEAAAKAKAASLRALTGAAAKAAATQRRAEEAYARDTQVNQRICYVLGRSTGVDLRPQPEDWYDWWQDKCYDYYELERPHRDSDEKPVYEKRSFALHQADVTPYSRGTSSCFPQGTKVWTLTGPVAIEEIQTGDQVLSQHPESGELAYKPIMQTTTRDPSPMIKIDLGSETIAATRGHPFWVAGKGWRMAKQIEAGLPLHGLSGAVSVVGVEEAPPAEAWYEFSYNLIVDDFHTYFVGDNRILVHDNRLFAHDHTSSPLPGLPAP
jgi:hypothetical protein